MGRANVVAALSLLSKFVATTAAAQTRVQNTRFRENKLMRESGVGSRF